MSNVTQAQQKLLIWAFAKQGAVYAPGSRAGGARFRMIERMVASGLLSATPPHAVAKPGLIVLRDHYARRWADRGCMAYLADLQEVEAALAAA